MEAIQPLNLRPTEKRISFRDPSGSVFSLGEKIVRHVTEACGEDLTTVLSLPKIIQWTRQAKLIETTKISRTEFHHPRLFFPTYPFEWCPEMLYAAAETTLEFSLSLLKDGYGLKDASARNVLFSGVQPVFVDLLSFEKRHPNDATWMPFEQFLKNFIYPLALSRTHRATLRSYFYGDRDGKTPSEVARMMGLKAYTPRYFALIAVPHLLYQWSIRKNRRSDKPRTERFASSRSEAQFILSILLKHLRHGLERVKPILEKRSMWSRYHEKSTPYSAEAAAFKASTIKNYFDKLGPKSVLDLGCNDGKFSFLAAKCGAKVVSVDNDGDCISQIWKQATAEKLDILPLNMELNQPSPGLGWNNSETQSFLERANRRFDLTLSLALFHHLILQSLPIEEIIAFVKRTTNRFAIIEYVGPDDSQVKKGLVLGRRSIRYPSREDFVNNCGAHFQILESRKIPHMDREIFLVERKG